jgi:hypothetical protein
MAVTTMGSNQTAANDGLGRTVSSSAGGGQPPLIAIHNYSTSALLNDRALFITSASTKVMLFVVLRVLEAVHLLGKRHSNLCPAICLSSPLDTNSLTWLKYVLAFPHGSNILRWMFHLVNGVHKNPHCLCLLEHAIIVYFLRCMPVPSIDVMCISSVQRGFFQQTHKLSHTVLLTKEPIIIFLWMISY